MKMELIGLEKIVCWSWEFNSWSTFSASFFHMDKPKSKLPDSSN